MTKRRRTIEEWENERGLKDVPKEQVTKAVEREYDVRCNQ